MNFALLRIVAAIAFGMLVVTQAAKYLLSLLHLLYYLLPLVGVVILASRQRLVHLPSVVQVPVIKPLSALNYLWRILALQVGFYCVTFWLFAGYIAQTKVSLSLPKQDMLDFIMLLHQQPILYTLLPFFAIGCYALGLLYFVLQHNKEPALTSCFYQPAKKMPWLYFNNLLHLAETHSSLIALQLVLVAVVMQAANAISKMLVDFDLLANPWLFALLASPLCAVVQYNLRDVVGWLSRKRCSLGLMLLLFAVSLLLFFVLVAIAFAPWLITFSSKYNAAQAATGKSFSNVLSGNFPLLILGWFFINMPRLGSMIGRYAYGFTMRGALLLNMLATAIVAILLHLVTFAQMLQVYQLLQNQMLLFNSCLVVLFMLWLYASDICNLSNLKLGPMLTVANPQKVKWRSMSRLIYQSLFVMVTFIGGIGCVGWRFSQYYVGFVCVFLLPVYAGFTMALVKCLWPQRRLFWRQGILGSA